MKVSFNWLKQYIDTKLSAAEVADKFTMAGLEVKSMQTIGSDWEGVMVGEVRAVNPHPNADRLKLVDVSTGKEDLTIVCGAPNCAAGIKIAYASVGAKLTDPRTGKQETLKPAKIRGVESSGMACSEKELGISDSHEGIIVLPADAPVGTPLADYLGDTIFNFEITPNRPDCLCMTGLARELSSLTGEKLTFPDLSYEETDTTIEDNISVEIIDSELCPRYCATLITDVKIGESPEWLKQRLASYGIRSISNVVDVTNFVMLEFGQPLHSFDYDKLSGKSIIVRRGNSGETIVSLDDEERKLTREMLVIADKEKAVAVAGIMGGANSEVSENTTSILLESASFKSSSVHFTGRTLGLPSEACVRFERGITAEMTLPALKRATQLLVELCGGKAAKGIIDVYPGKTAPKPITLTTAKIKKTLGMDYSVQEIADALKAMGFECRTDTDKNSVTAVPPYWRGDVSLPVDLVEEVARHNGYDSIPTTLLAQPIPPFEADPLTTMKKRVRSLLVGYGFQDIVSYAMTGMEALTKLSPKKEKPQYELVHIHNPMTIDHEYLRPTLRASLMTAASVNKAFLEEGLRLFEIGKVYFGKGSSLPEEKDIVCGVMGGKRNEHWWQGESGNIDFFDARGIVESLLGQLGMNLRFDHSEDATFHPEYQATVIVDDKPVGIMGQIHPAVCGHFELNAPIYMFELEVSKLVPHTGYKPYKPIAKFPASIRDIALVVDQDVTHQQIVDIIGTMGLVTDVKLFDVYVGDQVAAGKKSLAYRISYQSANKTLTDKEVNAMQGQILKRLTKELGAELRS